MKCYVCDVLQQHSSVYGVVDDNPDNIELDDIWEKHLFNKVENLGLM